LPRKLRIAFHPDFGYAVEPEVRKAVERAALVFRELGHSLTVIDEPVAETRDAWRTIGSLQTLANLGREFEQHPEEFGRSFMATAQRAERITWREYGDAYRVRSQFNEWMRGVFQRYDLLLTPTLPTVAFGASGPPPTMIDGKELKDGMEALVFTYPFNLSGHPAASVRAGLTAEGLPCGMQIVAERMRDDLVLQASYAYEQARPWNDQWPAL
jgi:aspartyl-tRNA(Asn)/glutamyl-tRNA(Gln) amidotransferase subunit A